MPLTSGTKLGPYEVVSPIGAGGMGEVYKARDTRLSRTVAIKVLPSHLSQNDEMKARFEREAKTIGGLNHPHICVLHDIGHQDGVDFLVMEYLEGQTLAERLEKGPLPLHEALKIALEIADALEKAHREGVVHRDLKPSNVMLTKAGTKLLDFGLAKLNQESQQLPTLSALPTNPDVTAKGTILGTGVDSRKACRRHADSSPGVGSSTDTMPRQGSDPRVSPDGQRLLFESTSEDDDIWVLDLRRDAMTRLSFDPGEDETPVWSPDGKWVAYSGSHTNTGAARNIFRKPADGSGAEENLFGNPNHMHVDDWSHDGSMLLIEIQGGDTQTDIWTLPLDGKGKAQSLLSTKFNERDARLSPDGHWIAYTSNESGNDEVYVQAYPSMSAKWQVSTHGGDQSVWSRNGKTLYYRGTKQLMAVDLTPGATLQLSAPRALFDDVYETKGLNHVGYDIAPDGKILFVRDNEGTTLEKYISIVENFLPELKKRIK